MYITSHSPVMVEQSVVLGALLVHAACAFLRKVRPKHSKMQILGNTCVIFSVERCFSLDQFEFQRLNVAFVDAAPPTRWYRHFLTRSPGILRNPG